MSVSSSRLTLLPLVLVGSSERAVSARPTNGSLPSAIELRSVDSKSTWPARKPGVSMFAMLSAIVR